MSFCDAKTLDILRALVTCLEFYGEDWEEKGVFGLTGVIDLMVFDIMIICAEKIRNRRVNRFTLVNSDR